MGLRYQGASADLYIRNRKKLAKRMESNALALVFSNDRQPTNGDGLMDFRQNSQLLYLSGIDQEGTILAFFPDSEEPALREILFVKERDPLKALWEGAVLSFEEARAVSGIQSVYGIGSFEAILARLMCRADHVYLETNEHERAEVVVETRTARFIRVCRRRYPLHSYLRLAPVMADLRARKEPEEVAQIQKACKITEAGFRQILTFVKPNIMEYEIEAQYAQAFLSRASRGFAYAPIIASGKNACVLHYTHNSAPCLSGDMILMDVGAEYANYCADMTRCVPVNGRFTKRQRAIYEAVLSVMRAAMNALKPKITLPEYHKQVGERMQKELCDLKLLNTRDIRDQKPHNPAYKRYFMHGTSHHLGLDVHDVPSMHAPVEVGMVFTVEPGIYIPEENIGIRLENDILITKDGYNDLMQSIPIEVDELESLMNG